MPTTSPESAHIKSRQRVRDLAEVYTHEREVALMLDAVPDMFPSEDSPANTDRKFLEPACGSGNFLEAILRRKINSITPQRYGQSERYEFRILRALASIYAIDIDEENIVESRARLRAVLVSKIDYDLTTRQESDGFADAVEAILITNVLRADALKDARSIRFVDYQSAGQGFFVREWSPYVETDDLLTALEIERDIRPVHYSELLLYPSAISL
jgi:hypothetical protein